MGRAKNSVASTALILPDAAVRRSKKSRLGVEVPGTTSQPAPSAVKIFKSATTRRQKPPPTRSVSITESKAAGRTRSTAAAIKPTPGGEIAIQSKKGSSTAVKRKRKAQGEPGAETGDASTKQGKQPDSKFSGRGKGVMKQGGSTKKLRGKEGGQGGRRGRSRQEKSEAEVQEGVGEEEEEGESGSLELSEQGRVVALVGSHDERLPNPNHELNELMGLKDESTLDAVVKVLCVHTEPNFSLPWQRKRQYSSSSSGFVIDNKLVLTNAHSVEHHRQVKVKKRGSDTKFLATVLAVGRECDIALLTVADDEFWSDMVPLQLGTLPRLQDPVTVVGYPIGGDTISVTSGVVSRIEVTAYLHGGAELLGVQIDAAINSGNSGGPAFNGRGECVGVAFQSMKADEAENIGYVIPTPVIQHFITDFKRNGVYTGFPILGVEWQKMENPCLRRSFRMLSSSSSSSSSSPFSPPFKGVRIRRVEPTAPAAKVLRPDDVLLSFNGVDIANDGTVPFRAGERIAFSYLVSQKFDGDKAKVAVLRNGRCLSLTVTLRKHHRLVPVHIQGHAPSYLIVAGIVFTPLTVPYLKSEYGKDYDFESPVKLLDCLLHKQLQREDEEVVMVSQVLVADVNIGYESIVNTQLFSFNGVPVKNLPHLATMVADCKEEFMRFELEYDQVVVLDTTEAKAATEEILKVHCIPSPKSEDL